MSAAIAPRRKIVCCPECKKVMRSVLELEEEETEADPHLYLLTPSAFLTGLVKIGRTHKPFQRACQLQDGMPFHLRVECVWPFAGAKENEVHEALRAFRVEASPGTEWFRLDVEAAHRAIGKILFEPRASATASAET